MELIDYLSAAVQHGASDVFVVAGGPVSARLGQRVVPMAEERTSAQDSARLVASLYRRAERPMTALKERGDDRFSFSAPGLARFRVSAYQQRGSLAAVVRVVAFGIPDWKKLGLPERLMALADEMQGLILVAGAARSGKSTTQACLVDQINRTRDSHIITIEDPIEYLHRDQRSIISQREVGIDTEDGLAALGFALQQSPDVIMLSEMQGQKAIQTALSAAETGQLVIAAMHTQGAVNTLQRLVKAFPGEQREQVREQFAAVLRAVVFQQLLPAANGGVAPAFEILCGNSTVRPLISGGQFAQLAEAASSGSIRGMLSMEQSLLQLYQKELIGKDTALKYSADPEMMKRKMWIIRD